MGNEQLGSVYATVATLGGVGPGTPATHSAAAISESAGPCVVLAGGDLRPAASDPPVQVLQRPWWRRRLYGTRFHRFQLQAPAKERRAFDRRAAAALPDCRLFVGENSTCRTTQTRARAFGARLVLLQHNLAFGRVRSELEEERKRWGGPPPYIDVELLRAAEEEADRADTVVCFSHLTAETMVAAGVRREKLRVVSFGVDSQRFRPGRRPGGPFTVAFVGWLSLGKGYPYLVQAFRDARIPGARLLMHGGSDRAFHHDLVSRLKGDADVQVLRGAVDPTFRSASVLVLPSVEDAYGLVVLEAMASGVPVIVTDACGAAEDVSDGETGFIVPPRDSAAIRDRLLRLYEEPDLGELMGVRGREIAVRRTWARYREALGAVIHGVPGAAGG